MIEHRLLISGEHLYSQRIKIQEYINDVPYIWVSVKIHNNNKGIFYDYIII